MDLQKKLNNSRSEGKNGAQPRILYERNSGHNYALKHPKSYPDTVRENFLTPPRPDSGPFSFHEVDLGDIELVLALWRSEMKLLLKLTKEGRENFLRRCPDS